MKKGILPLGFGILILIVAIAAPLPLFISLISESDEDTQFLIPAKKTVQVTEPGKYYLWHNHKTVFDGTVFSTSEELPHGLKIAISDHNDQELRFISDASMSSTSGSSAKQSIGYVELSGPQELHISVTHTDEQRVFSFAQSRIKEFFTKILGFLAITFLGAIIGIVFIIIGVLKLNKTRATPPPLP